MCVHKTNLSNMSNREGVGNFVVSEDELTGTTFDMFTLPDSNESIISGKEVEIRLFTVLDRQVFYFCTFYMNLFYFKKSFFTT